MVQTLRKPFCQNQIKKQVGNLPSRNTENTKLYDIFPARPACMKEEQRRDNYLSQPGQKFTSASFDFFLEEGRQGVAVKNVKGYEKTNLESNK